MNESIKRAIRSICDSIVTSTNVDDNKKRAETVALLAFGSLFALEKVSEDENELTQQGTSKYIPAAGTYFSYNDIEFVALGMEQGGLLAMEVEPLKDEMPFDENAWNDWGRSTLRQYLNQEYIKNFNKEDLLPFVSDITTDSGQKDYETSEDYIALLSCDLYRKYCEYVPKYSTSIWTLTPWHISPSNAQMMRVIEKNRSVTSTNANYSGGVVPICLFNLTVFE